MYTTRNYSHWASTLTDFELSWWPKSYIAPGLLAAYLIWSWTLPLELWNFERLNKKSLAHSGDLEAVLASFPSTGASMKLGVQAVLECCAAFQSYKAPEGDDPGAHVMAMLDLAAIVWKKCGELSIPEGQDRESGMLPAARAMCKWSQVLQHVCFAKSLDLIINAPSPETPWNYKKMLPLQHQAFARALQQAAGLKDDMEALSSSGMPDLEEVTKRLALFETVTSALDASLMAEDNVDPLFKDLKATFENFVALFLKSAETALSDFEETHFPVIHGFIGNYTAVAQAAEKWQMTPVASVFTDKHDETKEALEQLMAAKENLGGVMGSLETFCAHISSGKALVDLVAKAKGMYKAGVGFIKEADRIGGILLVGAVLYNNGSAEDAKATLDMANKTFGTRKDTLPLKVQKMLGDSLKLPHDDAADAKDKQPAPKTPGRKRNAPSSALVEDKPAKDPKKAKTKGKDESKKEKAEKAEKADKAEKRKRKKAEKADPASDAEEWSWPGPGLGLGWFSMCTRLCLYEPACSSHWRLLGAVSCVSS